MDEVRIKWLLLKTHAIHAIRFTMDDVFCNITNYD